MKVYKSARAWLLVSALFLTACDTNVEKSIKPFVEAPVVLKAEKGSNVFKGSIPFIETNYFWSYRTVCDTVQCGYDTREVCESVPRCTGTPRHCTSTPPSCSTSSVCHDESDSVCRTDSEGREVCTPVSRRVCSDVETCSGGGEYCTGGDESCTYDSVCHTVQEPRYCQENCREEPYRDSNRISHASSVAVTVTGADLKEVKELVLGVKTTSAYTSIFQNASSSKPEGIEPILKTLRESDKTLVLLRAKGLKLVDTSSFLQLPPNFKAGDPVKFDLKIESGGAKSGLSAVGSGVDFPALHWTTGD